MRIALIVAMARNGVIGRDNMLPWHLPGDLRHFKAATMGKPIIMGRKTYASIGRPLPGRHNIVVSRDTQFHAPGVSVATGLQAALALAEEVALPLAAEVAGSDVDEAMIIGGADIYRQSVAMADRIYLTCVDADIEGDTFFPEVDWSAWKEITKEYFAADSMNPYDYSIATYDKIKQI